MSGTFANIPVDAYTHLAPSMYLHDNLIYDNSRLKNNIATYGSPTQCKGVGLTPGIKFNGTNDKLVADVDVSSFNAGTPFTMGIWHKWGGNEWNTFFYDFSTRFQMERGPGGDYSNIRFVGYPQSGALVFISTKGIYNDSNWHLFVFTSDGTNGYFNIDGGSEIFTAACSGYLYTSINSAVIGGDISGADYANASLDKPFLLKRFMPEAEILSLYNRR